MRIVVTLLLVAGWIALLAPSATAQVNFAANLDGSQEVPAIATAATGTGVFTLRADDMLEFHIEFSGLSSDEIAAHFHGPAPIGELASPVFNLPLGSPKDGTVGPLSEQQKADLMEGLWYVNVHSTNHSGGEIRGQVLLTSVSNDADTWSGMKLQFER